MKNTNKIMAFWYFAKAIFGGAAAVILFLLIRKLSMSHKEGKPTSPKAPSSINPTDKDMKESLQIVQILDEIYKL